MESNIINTSNQNATLEPTNTNPKYRFINALRPFSLPVAAITCTLGISAGWQVHGATPISATLVLLAGLLLQAGVNLINDHADLKNPTSANRLTAHDIENITLNYRLGWICFSVCAIIGLYLTYQTSIFLLVLAIIGGLGALFYTTEPIHYKRRGLGVILVFLLMGVLMVYGAWFAVTGEHSLQAVWISLPVSFFTSALLLSNELRDYASDQKEGLKTLTVRWGIAKAKKLYLVLIMGGFVAMALLITDQQLWVVSLIFVPPLILAVIAIRTLVSNADLTSLPPMTGRLYLVFGISEIIFLCL